jgi:DNA-directed RNA polymerase specialized sigma24 family protein
VNPNTHTALLQQLVTQRCKYINFLSSKLWSRECAEEILQQVTVKVLEQSSRLRSEASAEAWIYRVLRNAIADHYRRERKVPLITRRDVEELGLVVANTAPRLCPCAGNQLTKIKPQYQEALREVIMTGGSLQAYAASRKINPNLASVRLHRARKSLRQRLRKVCGSCAGAGCFDCTC